jgi:4-amino-4-deoxy-L-arabinose transferase-like glycosyltransferase
MVQTGQWLVPTINHEPWLEKPPLIHWAIALLMKISGTMNEGLARLPSSVCGLLGLLVVAALAARTRGPDFGLLVGLSLATSVWFVTYARLAEADIYLWLLVSCCICLFAHRFVSESATWWTSPVVFFTVLGFTNLTKGPGLGAILTLAVCMSWALINRRGSAIWYLLNSVGWLVFLAIGAAWPALVLQEYPAAGSLWWENTVGRFSHGVVTPQPVWYYASTLPWQVLPWSVIMLPGTVASWRRAWKDQAPIDRLLWLWLLVPSVLLTCSTGKHHHYLIPALVPCAFWAAEGLPWWGATIAEISRWRRRWLLAPVGIALIAAGAWKFASIAGRPLALEIGVITAALWLVTVVIVEACVHCYVRTAAVGWFGLIWGCYAYVHGWWLPRTDTYRQETALLRRLPEVVEPGAEIYSYRVRRSRESLQSTSGRFDGPLYIHLARECYYSRLPIKALWKLDDLGTSEDCSRYVLSLNDYDGDLRAVGLKPCGLPVGSDLNTWPPARHLCSLFVLPPGRLTTSR